MRDLEENESRETMKTAFFRTPDGHLMFPSISKQKKFKACDRKKQYTNVAVNEMVKTIYRMEHRLLSTYLCPHCQMWHLTHVKQ
jgi:hypothetical protein